MRRPRSPGQEPLGRLAGSFPTGPQGEEMGRPKRRVDHCRPLEVPFRTRRGIPANGCFPSPERAVTGTGAFPPTVPCDPPPSDPSASASGTGIPRSPDEYYLQLVDQVDGFMAALRSRHPEGLTCRAGCSACCQQDLAVFPVEADRVRRALLGRSEEFLCRLGEQLSTSGTGACPLLWQDRCAVYPERPLICRTHGAPVLFREEEGSGVDVCPLNFAGDVEAIPPASVLDLDRLNEILVAVNVYYCRRQGQDPGARSTMSRILGSVLGPRARGPSRMRRLHE